MGLGPLHAITLADAREKATACRKLLTEGKDPIEARRQEDAQRLREESRSLTFRECAERYMASHQSKWRNQKHRGQWNATLSTYAFPIFGSLSVGAIDKPLVLQAITPLWSQKPETANRLRGRVETVLDWAFASGFRDPMTRTYRQTTARSLSGLCGASPSCPRLLRVGVFMIELRKQPGIAARALEFTILTAARTGEAIGARHAEFELADTRAAQ
jgi:hypothetical protein